MQKAITSYTINVLADPVGNISAQILFYNGTAFSGRIDFYKAGTALPASYLWHPTQIVDSQTYIVLAMSMDAFDAVATLVRTEGAWTMELWPVSTPMTGAATNGYSGKIFTSSKEPIGEEERSFQSGALA